MKPWTVDADDIQLASDLDEDLLHHTPGVDEFLEPDGTRFFVVGTKGLGKTLLLKAQRISYQQRMLCLPRNALIDKPVGGKVFNADMIALYGSATENWKRVWLVSIAAAVLKAVDKAGDVDASPRLRGMLGDANLVTVMDHFVNVLDFARGDLFRAADDVERKLIPRLRDLDTPIALFVDSIDEYFNAHILDLSAADAGELSPGVWYYSQMGLVEVVHQLRRLTHHLKVFAAIRKEAFDRLGDADPMVQQYRGSAVAIEYGTESLREIFVSNVRRERPKNLVNPGQLGADPFGAFLGLPTVQHAYTGEDERIFPYIYRHTLGRPRDLMTIGGRLARIPPEARTPDAVKEAVNAAATEIAQEYLNEISPCTHDMDLDLLFGLLPSNVFSAQAADSIRRKYRNRIKTKGGPRTERDPLGLLHCAGLLGRVETDQIQGIHVQTFAYPGQWSLHDDVHLPPSADYLVHSALAEIVGRQNRGFVEAVDRINVVGDRRPWREGPGGRQMCVLKADIVGFSRIMDTPEEELVREQFRAVVEEHGTGCAVVEIEGGDSVVLVHEDAGAMLRAAKRIMEDLHPAPHHPTLRVGIDRGRIELGRKDGTRVRGLPLRRAARLERIVEPEEGRGGIWVTRSVMEALGEAGGFYRLEPLGLRDLSKDDEPIEEVQVFRVT